MKQTQYKDEFKELRECLELEEKIKDFLHMASTDNMALESRTSGGGRARFSLNHEFIDEIRDLLWEKMKECRTQIQDIINSTADVKSQS